MTTNNRMTVTFIKVRRLEVENAFNLLEEIGKSSRESFEDPHDNEFVVIRLGKRSKYKPIEEAFKNKVEVYPYLDYSNHLPSHNRAFNRVLDKKNLSKAETPKDIDVSAIKKKRITKSLLSLYQNGDSENLRDKLKKIVIEGDFVDEAYEVIEKIENSAADEIDPRVSLLIIDLEIKIEDSIIHKREEAFYRFKAKSYKKKEILEKRKRLFANLVANQKSY